MIRHVVTWTLAADDPAQREADAEGIATRLVALVGVVPGLEHVQVGRDLDATEGNADVVLISDHVDEAALAEYQAHPAHRETAAYIRSVVTGRSSVDFEF
ncbi:MAG: Dabb family protein [Actinomycetales bacterium]|nr:Dabb family protein [Actinomycetales bacterium]